jgi:hypothetical protein
VAAASGVTVVADGLADAASAPAGLTSGDGVTVVAASAAVGLSVGAGAAVAVSWVAESLRGADGRRAE